MLCNYPDRKQMAKRPKIGTYLKNVSKYVFSDGPVEASEELVRQELCTIAVQHGMYRPYEARVYRFRNK